MKDQRIEKFKQHFDLFLNDQKFKVLSCYIGEKSLSIKTKVKGQAFPEEGRFTIVIPSKDISKECTLSFQYKISDGAIEDWEYALIN